MWIDKTNSNKVTARGKHKWICQERTGWHLGYINRRSKKWERRDDNTRTKHDFRESSSKMHKWAERRHC
jgi:hypothetical protein